MTSDPCLYFQRMSSIEIIVQVLKHDGAQHRRWHARLKHREGRLLVLDAEFDVDVSHQLMGEIPRGTRTVEYYWLDRWYSIFQFLNSDGSTRLYYCNVNTPPVLAQEQLSYIDLDIDILVQPGFSYQVLDLNEFEANDRKYGYSDEERMQAHVAVDQLISMIESRQFPFSFGSETESARL